MIFFWILRGVGSCQQSSGIAEDAVLLPGFWWGSQQPPYLVDLTDWQCPAALRSRVARMALKIKKQPKQSM